MVDGWKTGGCTLGWMNVRPGGWMEGRKDEQANGPMRTWMEG